MAEPSIRLVGTRRARLGECPLWDPGLRRIFWIDAVGERIFWLDPRSGIEGEIAMPGRVGCIVLGSEGTLIATAIGATWRVSVATGTAVRLAPIPDMGRHEIMNDGKTDRSGRLVTGSLTEYGSGASPQGRLLIVAPGSVTVVAREIGLANAICFSPAGDRLYFADSEHGRIVACRYDEGAGRADDPAELIDTRRYGSPPDGATVDADGDLWITLPLASRLLRLSPGGEVRDLIDLPLPFPSCPAFGGDDLATLYVTTIADTGGRLRTDHPEGGRLMAIEGLGVVGLAEARCIL